MSIHISQNLISEAEERLGVKFDILYKRCDFCDCELSKEHTSQQCPQCPTIFDVCGNCPSTEICHKCINVETKTLTEEEVWDMLDQFKVYQEWRFMTYRQRWDLIDYCTEQKAQADGSAVFSSDDYRAMTTENNPVREKLDITQDVIDDNTTDVPEKCVVPEELRQILIKHKCIRVILEERRFFTTVKVVGPKQKFEDTHESIYTLKVFLNKRVLNKYLIAEIVKKYDPHSFHDVVSLI